jgi:RNA polymerase sigma-70 factor (ECF subfamily)
MAKAPEFDTRSSLLARLRRSPTDQEAWNQFVECYGPLIYAWCRHWRLQEADAQDVAQNVLQILAVRLRTFAYDPALGFRNWLHVVTRHAWQAFVESRRRSPAGTGDSDIEKLLASLPAREDLVRRLEEQFDHELLAIAMERVQQRVEPATWDAFRLMALEHRPAAEAAEQLGLGAPVVFVYRSRVQRMLRDELRRLEHDEPSTAEEVP